MKKNTELLKEKKWAFILIFFITFFTPVFSFLANDLSIEDKCYLFIISLVIGLALSVIDLFLKGKGEKLYLTILLLLSIEPNLITFGYLYISRIYMTQDLFWIIFNTYAAESKEYYNQFIPWQIIAIDIVYFSAGVFFIIKTHSSHSLSIKKQLFVFIIPTLIVLIGIYFQCFSQAIPTIDFYKSNFSFKNEDWQFKKEKATREHLTIDIASALPDSVPHVFVVLIGESTTAQHMSLYGYHRKTTPVMDALSNELDIYTDVIPPNAYTYKVLQKALTFANHEHPKYYLEKPSIVEIFNSAGYETYWISNKLFLDKSGASYGAIATEVKHLFDLSNEKQHDAIVVSALKEVLNDGLEGNKIIFIHVMGNHHSYVSRYPESFNSFNHKRDNDLEDLGFRTEKMKKTIDEYDNSILYGDFVFGSILDELKQLDCSSYFLFFSDHGEEIFDTRNISGHAISNIYPSQCQIPFVLWRSDKYKEENPDLVIDTARSYSTENLIYSISTLSGLVYPDNDQSLSLFSSQYVAPKKRMVGKEDYKDILKKTSATKKITH